MNGLVAITLVQMEAVQLISHFTIDKRALALLDSIALCKSIVFVIITVDDASAISNNRLRCRSDAAWIGAGINPTVFGITTKIGHTTTREATHHAKVVNLATEITKDRICHILDGITIAMEVAAEAITCVTHGRPRGVCLRLDIATQEEFQIGSIFDTIIENIAASSLEQFGFLIQVVEIVEVVLVVFFAIRAQKRIKVGRNTVGRISRRIQVNLTCTIHILMVDEHTLFVVHHFADTMVVGHRERHRVRISFTQISLGIVSYIVVVLIPIHRGGVVLVSNTVFVFAGIQFRFEDFPSTTKNFVSTLGNRRHRKTYRRVGQYRSRRRYVANGRLTAAEFQVNVDDMLFAVIGNIGTITFFIVVTINHGDNTVFAQVENIRFARHINRRCLDRRMTLNGESGLIVGQSIVVVLVDDSTQGHAGTFSAILAIVDVVAESSTFATHLVVFHTIVIRTRLNETTTSHRCDTIFQSCTQHRVIILRDNLTYGIVDIGFFESMVDDVIS